MKRQVILLSAVGLFFIGPSRSSLAQSSVVWKFEGREIIPAFKIEGQPTRIHTQGLCVTADSYYVTGRLEREPKRCLLLRIDRSTRRHVEFMILTAPRSAPSGSMALDHPSGFDFDEHCFWIALSVSRPESHAVIVRVPYLSGKPLTEFRAEPVFEVDDHIGALAFDSTSNRLYGANWDTKTVYVWESNGHLVRRLSGLNSKNAAVDWLPAVQDWKSIGPGRVLAGGLDKRPGRTATATRSVLEIWQIDPLKRVHSILVPTPPGSAGEVANEGCAVWNDFVYFLPDDLGPEAAIYSFRRSIRDSADP